MHVTRTATVLGALISASGTAPCTAQRQASHGDVIRFHCYRCRQGNINVSSDSFAIAATATTTAAATAAANAAAAIVAICTVTAAPLRMWRWWLRCGPGRSATKLNLRSRVTKAKQLSEHSAAGRCHMLSCVHAHSARARACVGVCERWASVKRGGTHCVGLANEKRPSFARSDPKNSLEGGALLPSCQLELRAKPCVAGASVTGPEKENVLRSGDGLEGVTHRTSVSSAR